MDMSGGRRQSTDSSRLSVDTSYRMSGDYAPGADFSARASFESMQACARPRARLPAARGRLRCLVCVRRTEGAEEQFLLACQALACVWYAFALRVSHSSGVS